MKIVVGLVLIAHGLVHLLYFAPADDPKYPMTAGKSWLVLRAGVSIDVIQPLVAVLAVLSAVGFVLLALSYLIPAVPAGAFTVVAVFSAVVSLLLIAVTFDIQFVVGIAIDVFVLVWALAPSYLPFMPK